MTDDRTNAEEEAKLEILRDRYVEACGFAERLVAELSKKLPPVDAAGAAIGAGVNALVNSLGKPTAISYLRDLAAELERDTDPSTTAN